MYMSTYFAIQIHNQNVRTFHCMIWRKILVCYLAQYSLYGNPNMSALDCVFILAKYAEIFPYNAGIFPYYAGTLCHVLSSPYYA